MGNYYIKRLGRQELGLTADNRIARGRYFYISKEYLEFFPALSKTIKNDNVLLPIIPPFSDNKIYCTYVFHNDKFNTHEGTRDEYRIYLNIDIDPNRNYFELDDIVVFERIETDSVIPLYILDRFPVGHASYRELGDILNEFSGTRARAHTLFEGELPFLPQRNIIPEEVGVIVPQKVRELVVIQQNEILEAEEDETDIENTRGASLFRSESFRDFVLLAYGHKCAITRVGIAYKNLNNLEAAHIQPRAHLGNYLPCNGIALSRDMHWAFDKGLITVSDDYKIIVHEEIKNTILNEYSGREIIIPIDTYFRPEKKYLKHHRENVFGLFLYSGGIRTLK